MSHLISKQLFGAVVVIALVVVFFIVRSGREGHVTLSAQTDKESYALGEPITVTLTLTNVGENDICVGDITEGTIRLESVTVDGAEVDERVTEASYLTSLSSIIRSRLRSVAPGDDVKLTLTSEYDPGLQGATFYHAEVDGESSTLEFYDVGAPGRYELKLSYGTPGKGTDDCPVVFKGPTDTATVSFTVTQ